MTLIKFGSEGILHGQRVVCVYIKDNHGRPLDVVDTNNAPDHCEVLVCWNGTRTPQGVGWNPRSYYGSYPSEESDRACQYQYGWWIGPGNNDEVIWLKQNSEKYKEKLKKEFKELQFKPAKREKEISRLYYLRKQLNLLNDQSTPPTSE